MVSDVNLHPYVALRMLGALHVEAKAGTMMAAEQAATAAAAAATPVVRRCRLTAG